MTNLIVPFRAGRQPGENPAAVKLLDSGADVVLLADVSEFQPDIADAAYLQWSKAIVIRAMYGDAHDDGAWYGGARRAALLAGGCRFLGIYQYLVAGQDVTAQARAFCQLLGTLNPGEYPIADIEEGSGDLQQAWVTWANVVYSELGFAPGDYSGLNFAAAHGLAPVDWVAAYGTAEPAVPHKLWQFTDSYAIPGVGTADCSLFHGTIDQLAALAYGGAQPAPSPVPSPVPVPVPPPVPAWQETMVNALPTLQNGSADQAGQVLFVHRVQQLVNGISAWNSLGIALTVDGSFGPATEAGVKQIQQHFGLTQDGIVGPQTWGALIAG